MPRRPSSRKEWHWQLHKTQIPGEIEDQEPPRKIPWPSRNESDPQTATLAGQAGAVEGEAVERAEDSDGDLVRLEIPLGKGLEFFAGDGFDGSENFVERIEATEVQLLAGKIGHA